jgi:riboflavin synthase
MIMFTGIIQQVGRVKQVLGVGDDVRLTVSAPELRKSINAGDSVAVNGVCLTATGEGLELSFDVSVETLARTLIGGYIEGRDVNLETALTLSTPLGGHLVTGHVDGVAIVERLVQSARSTVYEFTAPRELARFIAQKGSIALDGISLTVNTVIDAHDTVGFNVNIVPYTLAHTNLGSLAAGDRVHVEVDPIARYLVRIQELNQVPGP